MIINKPVRLDGLRLVDRTGTVIAVFQPYLGHLNAQEVAKSFVNQYNGTLSTRDTQTSLESRPEAVTADARRVKEILATLPDPKKKVEAIETPLKKQLQKAVSETTKKGKKK